MGGRESKMKSYIENIKKYIGVFKRANCLSKRKGSVLGEVGVARIYQMPGGEGRRTIQKNINITFLNNL